MAKIRIPRNENAPHMPCEEFLALQDGAEVLEAKSLDDLVGQLRQRYPDCTYERTLHRERDLQREEAMDRLAEILLPRAYLEAIYVIQAELERDKPQPRTTDAEMEKAAARRGIALVDAGKWKQRDTWVHFPSSWIREILEMFAIGKTSLLGPGKRKRRRGGKAPPKSACELPEDGRFL